jgi:hypothetical protein
MGNRAGQRIDSRGLSPALQAGNLAAADEHGNEYRALYFRSDR